MFYLVKDDIGTQFKAVITRENDGSLVDLSSATVRMRLRAKGTTTVLVTLTSTASAGDAVIKVLITIDTTTIKN